MSSKIHETPDLESANDAAQGPEVTVDTQELLEPLIPAGQEQSSQQTPPENVVGAWMANDCIWNRAPEDGPGQQLPPEVLGVWMTNRCFWNKVKERDTAVVSDDEEEDGPGHFEEHWSSNYKVKRFNLTSFETSNAVFTRKQLLEHIGLKPLDILQFDSCTVHPDSTEEPSFMVLPQKFAFAIYTGTSCRLAALPEEVLFFDYLNGEVDAEEVTAFVETLKSRLQAQAAQAEIPPLVKVLDVVLSNMTRQLRNTIREVELMVRNFNVYGEISVEDLQTNNQKLALRAVAIEDMVINKFMKKNGLLDKPVVGSEAKTHMLMAVQLYSLKRCQGRLALQLERIGKLDKAVTKRSGLSNLKVKTLDSGTNGLSAIYTFAGLVVAIWAVSYYASSSSFGWAVAAVAGLVVSFTTIYFICLSSFMRD